VRRALSIALLIMVGCGAVEAPAPRVPRSPCAELAFRVPPVPPREGVELVIEVNDVVCRREPLVPGQPAPRGSIAEWCPAEVAPGGNRIEIAVVEGDCGRPRARAVFACAGPEPD
jgi:hypothetical protein